ncbi:SLC13 family permease [Microbispora sp. KK1-11]|uniref:SLC13 family permease n=1 Tax=Microbispora sp. KK1-11 TaxID=2053005 RepID=UPI0021AF3400|nr:SLC13 family permease [Microbispora sp. KK1-11]
MLVTKITTNEVLREVEWPTLVFFAGLFEMVGALVETGVIAQVSRAAVEATAGRPGVTAMVLLWASAGLSAIVDNIPYVATMSPIVADLAQHMPGDHNVLRWALALGADLGGNATAVGCLRQRRHPRHRRAQRRAHQLLGVHQVRPGGHRRHRGPGHAVSLVALPAPSPARWSRST